MNIIAPINQLGYGQVGVHVTSALQDIMNVSLFPIGQNFDCHPKHQENLQRSIQNAQMFDPKAPCIRIWHQFDMAKFVGCGMHVGWPVFELDTFTDVECHHLYSCDQIFVCSEWAKRVVRDNIYNIYKSINLPIHTIPLGVDTDIFTPVQNPRSTTIFLNIGKWEMRKGHDVLIDAFNQAFTDSDDVELWMMCDNPFLRPEQTEQWISRYKDSPLGYKVRMIPRQATQEEVAKIMQKADCGVFPSRAEGWNLEALEMMACGKQIIVTDYSAHTEFCDDDNSNLIHIYDLEPANDGIWFKGQGNWAALGQTQIQMLVDNFRKIHLDKQQNKGIMNEAGLATAQKYTWENTARTIIDLL